MLSAKMAARLLSRTIRARFQNASLLGRPEAALSCNRQSSGRDGCPQRRGGVGGAKGRQGNGPLHTDGLFRVLVQERQQLLWVVPEKPTALEAARLAVERVVVYLDPLGWGCLWQHTLHLDGRRSLRTAIAR